MSMREVSQPAVFSVHAIICNTVKHATVLSLTSTLDFNCCMHTRRT